MVRSRWQAVRDVWYLCRLARPPGVRRVGLFVVAFAASGAAALPMVLASSASALPEGRVSADAPALDDLGALRESDERARLVVSRELGHSRKQITSVYLSSSRATIEARRRDRR